MVSSHTVHCVGFFAKVVAASYNVLNCSDVLHLPLAYGWHEAWIVLEAFLGVILVHVAWTFDAMGVRHKVSLHCPDTHIPESHTERATQVAGAIIPLLCQR